MRGVLLQYHPKVKKSREALDELVAARDLLDPLVPLIEFRHRSWMEPDEQADTLAFLERNGLAYVSVDAPRTRASNVIPSVAAATHPVVYVRFHGRNWKTWNIRNARTPGERFDWRYSDEELAEWVEPLSALADQAEEAYALFNNNRNDYAPSGAQTLRRLLDSAGVAASGGLELRSKGSYSWTTDEGPRHPPRLERSAGTWSGRSGARGATRSTRGRSRGGIHRPRPWTTTAR